MDQQLAPFKNMYLLSFNLKGRRTGEKERERSSTSWFSPLKSSTDMNLELSPSLPRV